MDHLIATVLSALILLAAPWPLTVLLIKRPFWSSFPSIALAIGVAFSVYAVTVAGIAWWLPALMVPLAASAAIVLVLYWWRARPTYGVNRGLPPGSLAVAPTEMWLDPNFFIKQYEKFGPVFKSSHFLKPMVCIVGFDKGFDLLRKYEDTALFPPEAPFARYIPCSYIRSMTPETHRKYRPLLQAAISSVVTDGAAPLVSNAVVRGLDQMVEDSRHTDSGLRPSRYFQESIYEALFSVFFGVQPGSDEHARFSELYETLYLAHRRRATALWSPKDDSVNAAVAEVKDFLQRRIARFSEDLNQPPRSYIESGWQQGGLPAVDDVVLSNLIFLLQVSCIDLVGLFQWIMKKLSNHPEWKVRLREVMLQHGKESEEARDLAERIVSETFRLEQSEHIYRNVLQPIQIGDFQIPKGWMLRICVRESHHCSPIFEEAESFNPDRFLNRSFGPTEYAPFGMFRKRCIGVYTIIRIGGIFVKELVAGYDWDVTDPGIQDFRGWHWTPGESFAFSLRHRDSQQQTLASDIEPMFRKSVRS